MSGQAVPMGCGKRNIRFAMALPVLLFLGLLALPMGVSGYYLFLANLIFIYIVLTLGLNILMGEAGLFSLAHVAFYGMGAYATGIVTNLTGLPIIVGIVVGQVIAGVCGMIIGAVSIRLRDVYLALSTFAFSQAMNWVFQNWHSVTGGQNGLRVQPANLFGLKIDSDRAAFYVLLVSVFLIVIFTRWLGLTRFGRALRALRESEPAALAVGIPVRRMKITAFALSAVYAATAGGLLTTFQSYIHPDQLDFNLTIFVLTTLVVGGIGSVSGAVIGAILLGVINEVLRRALSYQEVLYGLIIVTFMVFAPNGVVGILRTRFTRWWS